jgi:hypothetical protein
MVPPVKKNLPARARKRKRTRPRDSASIVDLVRTGVERFILEDANMMSFMRAVRLAAKKGESSSHPLTGAAFRQIVRGAVRKRKRRTGRPSGKRSKSGGKKSL